MAILTQEELLQLQLDSETELEMERIEKHLESDEYYQSTLSRIQNAVVQCPKADANRGHNSGCYG